MQSNVFRPRSVDPLRRYVHSVFQARDAGPGYRHETILPKGNVDLLFNIGDDMDVIGQRSTCRLQSGGVQIAGVQTLGFMSRPRGVTNLIGISLRMEYASAILPGGQDALTDNRVEARCLLEGTDTLLGQLADAATFDERRALLLEWVTRRMREREREGLIAYACSVLQRRPTATRVSQLADQAGMSARHFQRVFTNAVGVAPSRYVRLSRFIRALHLMAMPTLTDVAHAAGYTDQAHFCRDFREFAGMTPADYRRGAGHVPGHVVIADGMSDSFKADASRPHIIGEEVLADDEGSPNAPRPGAARRGVQRLAHRPEHR